MHDAGYIKNVGENSLNILFSMLCRDFHSLVVSSLYKTLDISKSIAITEAFSGDTGLFDQTFEMGDCFRAYYWKYSDYEECPAIDDEIIDKMHPYDMEILKMMDRHQGWKWNYEKRMQAYYQYIRFWNHILDKYDINYAIFMNVPHEAFDYTIYCLCEIKNINTITFYAPPVFWDRSIVSFNFKYENKFLSDFLNEYYSKDVEYSNEVTEKYNTFVIESQNSQIQNAKKRWWTGATSKSNIKYMSVMDVREYIETERKKNGLLKKAVKKHKHFRGVLARVYYINNLYKTKRLDRIYKNTSEKKILDEKYVLYLLHYQPEATSSPQGGGIYSNQIIPVQILADSLPNGIKLYVKEHPAQTQIGRDPSLYQYLRRIKNVRLISKKIDTYTLLENAIAVSSLTGTIIIESVTSGIPAIAFGIYSCNCLEGVYSVRTIKECKMVMEEICSGKVKIDTEKVKKYFQAIYDYSYPINVGYFEYDDEKNALEMTKVLVEKIKEKL